MPYVVHSVLESYKLTKCSVYVGSRRSEYESRSSGFDIHLITHVSAVVEVQATHSLGAPTLDNTRQHHLLGVIGNEGNEVIYDTPEMSIWTSANHGHGHPWMQWV